MKSKFWNGVCIAVSAIWFVGVTMYDHHNFLMGVIPVSILWAVVFGLNYLFRDRSNRRSDE